MPQLVKALPPDVPLLANAVGPFPDGSLVYVSNKSLNRTRLGLRRDTLEFRRYTLSGKALSDLGERTGGLLYWDTETTFSVWPAPFEPRPKFTSYGGSLLIALGYRPEIEFLELGSDSTNTRSVDRGRSHCQPHGLRTFSQRLRGYPCRVWLKVFQEVVILPRAFRGVSPAILVESVTALSPGGAPKKVVRPAIRIRGPSVHSPAPSFGPP